jgi:hypothetical protein
MVVLSLVGRVSVAQATDIRPPKYGVLKPQRKDLTSASRGGGPSEEGLSSPSAYHMDKVGSSLRSEQASPN